MALVSGTRLGPYEILTPLGAGGMGEVYRARDTRLGRDVAVKVLPDHLASDRKVLARFESEAKAVAALSHPNILALYDVGESNGIHFAVTELLEGETLRALVARGAVPVKRALEVAHQVADGLAAAHEKGIVHRDLKPENVFLTRDGHAKILDFGLARRDPALQAPEDSHTPTQSVLTEAGAVLGTVSYMSPEQARGRTVDFRSDQFSLGVVLYEMLAGRRPFLGASAAETLTSIIREEPAPLESLARATPAPVRWIVERLLAKEPEGRYASTRDLVHDLEAARTRSSEVRPGDGTSGLPKAARPRWRAALLAAFAAGAALGGLVFGRALLSGRGGSPSHPSFTRLVTLSVSRTRPALSPRGDTICYATEKSPGDSNVWTLRVGGENPLDLTPDHAGYDGQPAFSPDGTLIAFRSDRDGGGLFLMGATGESPRRLTTFGYEPAWFPDGKRIVFSTVAILSPHHRFGAGQLWTVDVPSGEARKLVVEGDAVQPAVSPHGTRIAYWGMSPEPGPRNLYTIAASGSAEVAKPVQFTGGRVTEWAPVWSPDGRYLYFGSTRDGTMNLWRVPIDESTGRAKGAAESIGLPASWAGPFSLSADGRRLAFTVPSGLVSFERIPFDPSAERISGPTVVLFPTGTSCSGGVSPKGDRITYWARASWSSGDNAWVARSDGTGIRRLTEDGSACRWTRFSADGTRVFFQSHRGGPTSIWSVGVDARGLAEVARHPMSHLLHPVPSPDGRLLAVYTMGEGARLIRLPTTLASPLPPPLPALSETTVFWPWSWSADSLRIAGTASLRVEGDAGSGIYLYDVAKGTYTRVRETGEVPRFLSDGRRLVFMEGSRIRLLEIASGRTVDLLEAPGGSTVSLNALAPDDRSLYVNRSISRCEIWLAEFP